MDRWRVTGAILMPLQEFRLPGKRRKDAHEQQGGRGNLLHGPNVARSRPAR